MKPKRKVKQRLIVGYNPETHEAIYENRTICKFCHKDFTIAGARSNHELHACKLNPDIIRIKSKIRKQVLNPRSLIQTNTYKVSQVPIYKLLLNPTKYHPYYVLDKPTDEILQFRQIETSLHNQNRYQLITLLEYKHQTLKLSVEPTKPKAVRKKSVNPTPNTDPLSE